jgi:hypothetical protein
MGGSGADREVTRGTTEATLWTSSKWELSQDPGKLSEASLADVDAALNPGEIYREPKDTHDTADTKPPTPKTAEPEETPTKEVAEATVRPTKTPTANATKTPKTDAKKTPTADATKTLTVNATKLLPLSINPEASNPMWSATDMGGSGADREVTRGTTEATSWTSSKWELSQDPGKLSEASLADVDAALNPGEIYREPKDTHEETQNKMTPTTNARTTRPTRYKWKS